MPSTTTLSTRSASRSAAALNRANFAVDALFAQLGQQPLRQLVKPGVERLLLAAARRRRSAHSSRVGQHFVARRGKPWSNFGQLARADAACFQEHAARIVTNRRHEFFPNCFAFVYRDFTGLAFRSPGAELSAPCGRLKILRR